MPMTLKNEINADLVVLCVARRGGRRRSQCLARPLADDDFSAQF
jgi:hypothetical protein